MDVRYRFAGTIFGASWNVIQPLALIAVYSIIFGVLLHRVVEDVGVPYPIFLCAGLLPWLAFTECITKGCMAFRSNAAYLKRLQVPEEIYIAQTVLSATIKLAIGFSLILVIALIMGHTPSWRWLLIPIPLLLLQAVGLGIGLALGTLNVFFPDIREVVPFVLRLAIWAAPVIFPLSFYVDRGFGGVLALNPATGPLTAVRDLFIYDRLPTPLAWGGMFAWVIVAMVVGLLVLRLLRREIRDVL